MLIRKGDHLGRAGERRGLHAIENAANECKKYFY
jgi:hypothetical protein